MNHFCNLIDATPAWKMSSAITGGGGGGMLQKKKGEKSIPYPKIDGRLEAKAAKI